MPQNNKGNDIDVDKLINDSIATIDSLIKSENEKMQALKNEQSAQTPAPAAKTEGSAAPAPVKKDEMTGNANPEQSGSAPEASSAPAPEASQSAPPEDSQPQDDGADLQGLVSSLDDGMLQELMQVVQMEMEARQSSQQGSPEQSQQSNPETSDNIAPAPEASQQMAPASDMAMKSEVAELKSKLAKSEENFANLQASVLTITETITKSASKPRPKAVTEIKDVQIVDRGDAPLEKGEKGNKSPSQVDIAKKMNEMAADRNILGSLNKSEMGTLMDFLTTKQVNDKVLQLFNK